MVRDYVTHGEGLRHAWCGITSHTVRDCITQDEAASKQHKATHKAIMQRGGPFTHWNRRSCALHFPGRNSEEVIVPTAEKVAEMQSAQTDEALALANLAQCILPAFNLKAAADGAQVCWVRVAGAGLTVWLLRPEFGGRVSENGGPMATRPVPQYECHRRAPSASSVFGSQTCHQRPPGPT